MVFEFVGEVIEWRGPAPFVFVVVPPDISVSIKELSIRASYGWGVIPVVGWISETEFTTSLFPRNGTYLVPVKVAVQRAESVQIGDVVAVRIGVVFGGK